MTMTMTMTIYSRYRVHRPSSLAEALELLSRKGDGIRVVAGATDVSIYMRSGTLQQEELMDLSGLRGEGELGYVRDLGHAIEIGAMATYSQLLSSPAVSSRAPVLAQAIGQIGSPQIRALGTLVGNVANASPAGDGIPPLYVLGARMRLVSSRGTRELPVEDFILGPRRTARSPDELISAIVVDAQPSGSLGFFRKLGLRASNAIAVASVAGVLEVDHGSGRVEDARLALGAVAPTVVRSPGAEAALRGRGWPLDDAAAWEAAEAAARDARPITDVRGSAEYRRMAVAALTYESLSGLRGGA